MINLEISDFKKKKFTNYIDNMLSLIEKLSRKNDGILPNVKWLLNNGYQGLYRAMRKYPEEFSHIKQEKKHLQIEDYISTAEKLVRENRGILPNVNWLLNNGYWNLYQTMRKYPEKFSHIKQEKVYETKFKKYVMLAGKLSRDNGDILPNPMWLLNNGYQNLYKFIKKYPEEFSHIKGWHNE